jgi:hypothetical protein
LKTFIAFSEQSVKNKTKTFFVKKPYIFGHHHNLIPAYQMAAIDGTYKHPSESDQLS